MIISVCAKLSKDKKKRQHKEVFNSLFGNKESINNFKIVSSQFRVSIMTLLKIQIYVE